MPPKAKVTKEMIVEAAFEIVKEEGIENLNARNVSKKLGCSTQPVMYHFKTIEALKREAYLKADAYHSFYLMNIQSENPMKDIGFNYIQFAVNEKNLFRFLFQSNEFSGKNITELINSEELQPILMILSQSMYINEEQAKILFRSLFIFVHGYASILANNEMNFEKETISNDLDLIFEGILNTLENGED